MSEKTTKTITLTGRRPVIINESDWPVMASAKDWDGEFEAQANRKWTIEVRQHRTDARTLVYGIYTTQYQRERDRRGGELLAPPDGTMVPEDEYVVWPEIAAAVHRVAAALEFDARLAEECIGDLPAEEV